MNAVNAIVEIGAFSGPENLKLRKIIIWRYKKGNNNNHCIHSYDQH